MERRVTKNAEGHLEGPHAQTRRQLEHVHNISEILVSWEHRWPRLEARFQDPTHGPELFLTFSKLLEKVTNMDVALQLLGLERHPALARCGTKAKPAEIIYNSDTWSAFAWIAPKIEVRKLALHEEDVVVGPSKEWSVVYLHLVDQVRIKTRIDLQKEQQEGTHDDRFGVQYYSMPFPETALRNVDSLISGKKMENWQHKMLPRMTSRVSKDALLTLLPEGGLRTGAARS